MRVLWALAFSVIATTAWADGAEKAMECTKIDDSLQRLTCFDLAFPKSAKADKPEPEPSTSGTKWIVNEDKSPIDDTVRITAGLTAKNVSYTGIGEGDAFLLLRCSENTTSAILSTNMFMTDEAVPVTTRFGDEKATTTRWSRSTDYKAVGLWNGGSAIPFIRSAFDHEKLVMRVQAKDRLDAVFDLGNVKDAARKIATACNWKLDENS